MLVLALPFGLGRLPAPNAFEGAEQRSLAVGAPLGALVD
jgi:hypothetical protein